MGIFETLIKKVSMAEAESAQANGTEASETTADATPAEILEEKTATPESAAPVAVDTSPPTDLESKVIRQIEYYFGDHNLKLDKFLHHAVKENDGWIPLETLVKFNRLKSFTQDFEVICTALVKSPNKLMEVHDDRKHIRRSPDQPLPEDNEERRDLLKSKTVYLKGFPASCTLDELLEFFKEFGEVENIMMRRLANKKFKGSVFALFKKKEEFDAFLTREKVLFKEAELKVETKDAYLKRKQLERQQQKEERKRKREELAPSAKKTKAEGEEDGKDGEEGKSDEIPKYEEGCILYLKGFKDNTSREDIKEVFDSFAKIAWVDFKRGDAEAWVRFETPDAESSLEKARAKNAECKIEIPDGNEITGTVLTGDEEAAFWKKVHESREQMRLKSHARRSGQNSRGRGRGRGRGYRGNRFRGGRGRGGGGNNHGGQNNNPIPKHMKFDSDDDTGEGDFVPSTNNVAKVSNVTEDKKRPADEVEMAPAAKVARPDPDSTETKAEETA